MKKNFSLSISLVVIGLLMIQSLSSFNASARIRQAPLVDSEVRLAWLPMKSHGGASGDPTSSKADGGNPSRALAQPVATFTVTNTNDSGPGSLRQAILDANNSPGTDAITFKIDSGSVVPASDHRPPPRIVLERGLSEITDPLILDGTTQAPFSVAFVEIDGSNAGAGTNGLTITAGDSVVKGLAIGNFSGHAISLQQLGNNMIMNNYLGTDASCNENRGNGGEGVNILNSNGNTIMGNTIVFNGDGGSVINSNDNVIRDNNLGTDATMTQNKGNTGAGFGFANGFNNWFELNRVAFNQIGFIGFGGGGNTFGGIDPRNANIIGLNGTGVSLNSSNNNAFKGNFIGTNPLGNDLGNHGAGIELAGTSSNNIIGGGTPNQGNTIAFNQTGVNAFTGANNNLYLSNSIHSNTLFGINNNGGANRGINPPQLLSANASASDTLITGRFFSFPNRQFGLHFYLGSDNPISEGKAPLGGINVMTNFAGMVDFSARAPFVLTGQQQLTGLATDLTTLDTSEFSNPVEVTGTGRPDLDVKKTGPETAKCGDTITYTITVTNMGTAAAAGATVTDTLPGCVEDEVTVAASQEQAFSSPQVGNKVVTSVPILNPGDTVTITIMATLTEDCGEDIVNIAEGSADGDTNILNNSSSALTKVDCVKITGFSVEKKKVRVSGIGFEKGDQIEINGVFAKKTKFIDIDELLAKKGAKLLLPCDPANSGRMNIIRLIRSSNIAQPVQDTQAFATCP